MKCVLLLSCLVLILYTSMCTSHDLTVGNSYGSHLVWQQKIEYMAYPFKKRVKEVFYSDPAQTIIKGVIARDLEHTGGDATITAGGVGWSYVNVRFKSESSTSLNYQLEIYV